MLTNNRLAHDDRLPVSALTPRSRLHSSRTFVRFSGIGVACSPFPLHTAPSHEPGGIHAVGRFKGPGLFGMQPAESFSGLFAHQRRHLSNKALFLLLHGIGHALPHPAFLDHGLACVALSIQLFRFQRIGRVGPLPHERRPHEEEISCRTAG